MGFKNELEYIMSFIKYYNIIKTFKLYYRKRFISSDVNLSLFHKKADECLQAIAYSLEEAHDKDPIQNFDLSLAQGVLSFNFFSSKKQLEYKYLLNKQPPNKQIWLSSPLSGPKRYDWVPIQNTWIYKHENTTSLFDLLTKELACLLNGRQITIHH